MNEPLKDLRRAAGRNLLLTATLAVWVAGSASGFVLIRLQSFNNPPAHWQTADLPLPMRINPAGSADVGDGSDIDAIEFGQETWNRVNTTFFEFDTPTVAGGTSLNSIDGINSVFFDETGAVFGAGSSVIAATFLNIHAPSGTISDADLVFNGQLTFSTAPPTPGGRFDIQAIATHELGHVGGMDHTGVLAATIFPVGADGQQFARILTMDDMVAMSMNYPETSGGAGIEGLQLGDGDWILSTGTIEGAVQTTTGIPVPGAHVVAVNDAGNTLVSDMTRPDGSFVLPGLPPDDYQVFAEPSDGVFTEGNVSQGSYSNAFLPFRLTFLGGNTTPTTITLAAGSTSSGNVIDLGTVFGEETESNNSSGSANPVALEALTSGIVNPGFDIDFFSFTASGGDIINIDVDAGGDGSPLDPILTLFDSDGSTVLAVNDDFPGKGLDSRLVHSMPGPPGSRTYTVRMTDFGGVGSPGSFYTTHVNKAIPEAEPNNVRTNANPAAIKDYRGGVISSASDIDFYSFTADFGDRILAEVTSYQNGTGAPLDPFLVLYDSFGATITSDDNTHNLDSLIDFTFSSSVGPLPNTFFLSVQHSPAASFPVGANAYYSLHIATDTTNLFYSALGPAGTGVTGFTFADIFPKFVDQGTTFDVTVAGEGIPVSGQSISVSGPDVTSSPTVFPFGTNSFGIDFFSQNAVVSSSGIPGPRTMFLEDTAGASAGMTAGFVVERTTVPPEVELIRLEGGGTTSWEAVTGHATEFYNAYRILASALADINADGVAENYGSAIDCHFAMSAFFDPAVPPLGEAYVYHFTAVNAFGEGTLGFVQTDLGPGPERPRANLALPCPPLP